MKLMALGNTERLQTGFTHKVRVTFADLTAAAVTQTLNIFPLTTGAMTALMSVARTAVKLITPFTGGAIATGTVDVGDAQTVGRYIAAANTDIFTALATNTKPHVFTTNAYIYSPANVTNTQAAVQLKVTTTVGNVNAATAGELDVYLHIVDFADLARPNANP